MIFLQTQRLRSSTHPLAQSMISCARFCSSQSSQVNRSKGLFNFYESQATLLTTQYLDLGTVGSSMSPLIVQGVLNLVKDYPAALSRQKTASGWLWRKVEGTLFDCYPSMVLSTISAFTYDHAMIMIFLAFLMVSIPMVRAHLGTFSQPPKQLDSSFLVNLLRQTNLVTLLTDEGGQLNPMCPVLPIPKICISIPPQDLIFFSQLSQNLVISCRGISPSGMLIFSGGMSMCLKRLWCIQWWQELESVALMGQYSSRLKVTTFLKLSSSLLWKRMSSRQTRRGLLPVARPRTQVCPWAFLRRISSLMVLAMAREPSASVWKHLGVIFSMREKRGNLARQAWVSFTGTFLSNLSMFFKFDTALLQKQILFTHLSYTHLIKGQITGNGFYYGLFSIVITKMVPYCHMGKYCMFLWPAYNCMKVKATIPRLSSSLLLLRNSPPSKLSFYNYEILILQRKEKLSFGSGLVFPGGKCEPMVDKNHQIRYRLRSELESAALRECFQETGLYFLKNPLLQRESLDKLERARLEYIANELNGVPGTRQKQFQKLSALLPPTQALTPFIRLITIPQIKQRYDTIFYVLPLEQYKYINFLKSAQHEKYLHSLEKIIFCEKEFDNFRWMNPAEILHEHFKKKSLIHPPQFIMLNVMLQFYKAQELIAFLKGFQPKAVSDEDPLSRNLNLGPNIVSLIHNKSNLSQEYPFAATLLGDAEFPFEKIISNEQSQPLRAEMAEWQQWQRTHLSNAKNRFLFKEGKRFFETDFHIESTANNSVVSCMKSWRETHELLSNNIFPQDK